MTHEAGFGNRKCEIFFATPGYCHATTGMLPVDPREHNLVTDRPKQASIERSLLRSE